MDRFRQPEDPDLSWDGYEHTFETVLRVGGFDYEVEIEAIWYTEQWEIDLLWFDDKITFLDKNVELTERARKWLEDAPSPKELEGV